MSRVPKTIMAVDNSKGLLILLNEVLTGAGYTFRSVTDPWQCLLRLETYNPDFLLIDVEMPEMDGFELCRKIRAMPSAKSLPIAFLTARNMQEDFKTGIDAGGNDYIVKPFTANTLLRHVNHWAHRAVALQPG